MRNQDKQARKFGGFPFFVKIYNHFLKFFYKHLLMLMIFPMLIIMRLLMKWKKAPWNMEIRIKM